MKYFLLNLASKFFPFAEGVNKLCLERAWAAAVEELLSHHSWPGGYRNMKIMGFVLTAMRLENRPSVDSLNRALETMKAYDLLVPFEEPAADA